MHFVLEASQNKLNDSGFAVFFLLCHFFTLCLLEMYNYLIDL